MSDELRWLRETCEAGNEEARRRAEVQAWMAAEAERGCLRYNRDAPMWHAYEAAAAHQQRAGATLNSVWPELLAVVEAARAQRVGYVCACDPGDEFRTSTKCEGCVRRGEQSRATGAALDDLDAAIRRSLDGAR